MTSVRKQRPDGCQGAAVMLLQITISPFPFNLNLLKTKAGDIYAVISGITYYEMIYNTVRFLFLVKYS